MDATSAWTGSPGDARVWRAGPWSLELRGDELADLGYRGRRVLRSVRAVVRDHDWNTASWRILGAEEGADRLRLRVRSEGFGSSLTGTLDVHAREGELDVVFDAVSEAEFATNRTGLVVLHPPRLAGAGLAVRHADGTRSQTRFPEEISPHQPVFGIAALQWEDDGLRVEVEFSGDVFEMEDQRNWTDASYKTYSRPLSLPFPYVLAVGERVRHELRVRVEERALAAARTGDDVIRLRAGGAFPAVGVGASTAPDPAPRVPPVGRHLVVELDLAQPNWRAALDRARAVGLPLDVRVVPRAEGGAGLDEAAEALAASPAPPIEAVAAFDPVLHVSDAVTVAALRRALAAARVEAPVAGGARSHFTELNRERDRLPEDLDAIVVTVTPLFHALGTAQLVESVAMQRLVARQTLAYAGSRPVRIGPIALRPRFNNVATAAPPTPTRPGLAEGYGAEFTGAADDRQGTPELAAWTIASAAALALPGVAALAYFEEWGPRGIRSAAGDPHPAAAAVEALAALAGRPLLWGDSPDGLVWAVGAGPEAATVLVANLDGRAREITIALPDGRAHRVSVPALSFRALAPGPSEG